MWPKRSSGNRASLVPVVFAARLLSVLSAALLPGSIRSEDAPRLFETVPPDGSPALLQPRGVSSLTLRRGANPARWQSGDRWSLPVGDLRESVMRVDTVRELGEGIVHVRGHLEGEAGSEVNWVFVGDRAAGVVKAWPGTDVAYLPSRAGRHTLRPGSGASGPQCGNDDAGPHASRTPMSIRAAAAQPQDTLVTNVVDLGFFYTPKAAEGAGGAGGMRALMELALLEANDAFARSGARVQLRAVCHLAVNYTESGTLSTDLDRFGRTGDGWMDEVHTFRDLYGADVCCLVTESENSNQFAGMANQLYDTTVSSLSRGFTACLRPYLVGNYTLPHEVGHLLGCNHDRANAGGQGLDPWSYGTRITVDREVYRTVMAYRPGLQFPHFSNPRVSFRGVPTGFTGAQDMADNVRTLNATAGMIAGVRKPAVRVGFGSAAIQVSEAAGVARLTWVRTSATGSSQFTVRTRAGSALAGSDFQSIDQRVTAADGAAEGVVDVRLIDNAVADGSRRFSLELVDPTSGLNLGPNAVVSVTIVDDETDAAALLDTGFAPRPGADYLASAVVASADGSVLVGGGFATFNGEPRQRLVRLRPDGSTDPAFLAQVKYRVNAIAELADGRIAIGGEFNTVNGLTRNHLAVLRADGTPDPAMDFEIGPDRPVETIASLPDGSFYIGGSFTNVLGKTAHGVARLTRSGTFDDAFVSKGSPDGSVKSIGVDALGRVTVGGAFRRFGGAVRGGLVRLKETGAMDDTFGGGAGAEGSVFAVGIDAQARPWVGGDFKRFHGAPSGGLVRLSDDGRVDPTFVGGTGANDAVTSIAFGKDGKVWIAGRFTEVGGLPRRHIARLNADGSVDVPFQPGAGPDNWVLAVSARDDGGVVMAGLFGTVNGATRGAVAALLGSVPASPRFLRATLTEGSALEWEAEVAKGQVYGVESSVSFSGWMMVETFRADGPRVKRVWAIPSDSAGFIRIRRVLE